MQGFTSTPPAPQIHRMLQRLRPLQQRIEIPRRNPHNDSSANPRPAEYSTVHIPNSNLIYIDTPSHRGHRLHVYQEEGGAEQKSVLSQEAS